MGTHIYVVDQSGNIVAMQNLDPTGMDIASISFTIPKYTTSLTAYEFCNLHGLWQGPTVVVDLGPPAEVNTEPQGQLFQFHHWIIGGGLLGVLLVGCVVMNVLKFWRWHRVGAWAMCFSIYIASSSRT